MEYLQCSGTKYLDLQANDEQNRKSGTPVAITDSSLPPKVEPPPLYDLFSTPKEDSVLTSVSAFYTENSKTLITVVVNTSPGGAGGWYGLCSSVSNAPTTSATTGMSTSLWWDFQDLLSATLDKIMVRSLKVTKCVLL